MIGKINLSGSGSGTNKGISPNDISNLKITNKDTKVVICWRDPEDTIIDNEAVCTWAGTKLVYKQGSFPRNPNDGIQVLDNTVNNNTKYYFRLFPYSNENVVNFDGNNAFTATPVEIVLNDCTNIKAKSKNGKVTIGWSDPEDIIENEETMARWVGTKLVMKQGSYPTSPSDGTVVVNNTIKNQYATTPYEIANLTNDTTYYFQLFPYTDVETYNTNETNRCEATPKAVTVYGVQRQISSSSTEWTRIEGGEGLVANATKDGGTVQNDFDNLYPWSDIISVDINADGSINSRYGDPDFSFTNPTGKIMTMFPEFWYKRVQENGYEKVYIADAEYEDFEHSELFYIGRYTATGSKTAITTKSGVTNLVNISMTDFRTNAKKIGNNWGAMDIWRWSMLQMLYLVEYADYDSQAKLGYGNCSTSAAINTGSCDALGMKSGCIKNDKKSGVIYRGVENIFSNIYQWLDGINIGTGPKSWVCKDRSQYASDKTASPYVQLGYMDASKNGYIKTMGYDSNHPEVQRATEIGGSDSTYCPDYFNLSSGYAVYVGGGWSDGLGCGLWYAGYNTSSYTYASIGGRLLFIPV